MKLVWFYPHAAHSRVENKGAGETLWLMFWNFCHIISLKSNKDLAYLPQKIVTSDFDKGQIHSDVPSCHWH